MQRGLLLSVGGGASLAPLFVSLEDFLAVCDEVPSRYSVPHGPYTKVHNSGGIIRSAQTPDLHLQDPCISCGLELCYSPQEIGCRRSLKERNNLEDQDVDDRIILQLKKCNVSVWTRFISFGIGPNCLIAWKDLWNFWFHKCWEFLT